MPMPGLKQIYDDRFYEEWGKTNLPYVGSAEVISEVLYELYEPKRLVDLGCGCGVYGHFFEQKGVEVVFIDGVQPAHEFAFTDQIQLRDLTVPIENIWGDFDLTLCLDVGEHIPESLQEPFIDNLLRFSDTLILACAPPKQGGHHHVNEQPKRYWVDRLVRKGFAYNKKRTGVLCERFKVLRPPLMWMWEQISVYERIRPWS